MKNLLVSEIFGPTIQGEGPATGRACAFIRLAICPLNCHWCDTPYTWAYTPALAAKHQSHKTFDRETEVHEMTPQEAASKAWDAARGSGMVVVSGGEPLAQVPPRLQKPNLPMLGEEDDDPVGMLAYNLYLRNLAVHVETAGIRFPSPALQAYVSKFVVSPKLATSGNSEASRRKPDVLSWFAQNEADFKFVITEPDDLSEVIHLQNVCGIPSRRIWLMPEGINVEAIQRKLPLVAEAALKMGYNVSTRLHVHIWGNKRGV